VRRILASSKPPTAYRPIVVCVDHLAVAESLELTLSAVGATAVVHDKRRGLDALPLEDGCTLIIDRRLLPPDPAAFLARLRAGGDLGLTIVLLEDRAIRDPRLEAAVGAVGLEKPFDSRDLIVHLPRA
jgi:hypothetical protein